MRNIGALIEIGLLIYCLIDCIQSDALTVRNLPKVVWILLIILLPVIGSIVWLVAGRPVGSPTRRVPWPSTQTAGFPEYERPRGPDDDASFLAHLDAPDTEREDMLARWEADLRARESTLRSPDAPGTGPAEPATGPADPPAADGTTPPAETPGPTGPAPRD